MWIIISSLAFYFTRVSADEEKNSYPGLFPNDYNKYEPPWGKGSPAHVYLKFNIVDVDRIDEGDMDFNIQTYVVEYWTDYRLNLSSFTQASDSDLTFPTYLTKQIWVPDIIFDNTKKGVMFQLSVPNTVVKILADGWIRRSTRYNLLVGCHMDFQFYPMDTQYCFVKICTLGNPDHKLRLHWIEENDKNLVSIELMNSIQPLKYVLYKPVPHKDTEVWTTGNFTYLYANFTFARRLSGTIFNVYIPSVLVVFLSWISFWLDVTAVPARVTLGVTSLLTLATQIVQAKANLPTISYLTAVDVWLLACLISVFSSLIEFAFSYQLFILSKDSEADDPYRKVNVVMQRDCTASRSRRKQDSVDSKDSWTMNSKTKSKMKSHGQALDKFCRKVFPLIFAVFSGIYWIYYLYNR